MLEKQTRIEIVKNNKFTAREIDIISVILNNRGEKKIASLLDISPRTVSSHVHNIMLKIGQNSKDGIIDFIQNSGSISDFNNHYQTILIQDIFRKYLIRIKQEFIRREIDFPISKQDRNKIKLYESDLKIAGINIIIESDSCFPSMQHFTEDGDYYSNLFTLIQKITSKSTDKFSENFKREIENIKYSEINIARKKGHDKLPYIVTLLMLILSTSIFFYYKSKYIPIARASLIMPHKNIYVERKALLQNLDKILSNPNQISVAIISGMEGTGKTILARSYAETQKRPII